MSRHDWGVAAALATIALVVFLVSPVAPITDSGYSLLLSQHMLERGRFDLDPYFAETSGREHSQIVPIGGHRYFWYPAGGSFLSMPLVAALKLAGVSAIRDGRHSPDGERRQQRIIAALLMAVFAGLVFATARLLLPWPWAVAIAISVAFGTQVWSTASRVLWSDTWGVLLGGVALYGVVAHACAGRALRPLALATALSWAYFARPTFCVLAVAVAGYVFVRDRRAFVWLAACGAAWLALFTAFHLHVFGQIVPYYHQSRFSIAVLPEGLAGNLVSPSRGLLFTVPWLLACACVLVRFRAHVPHRPLLWTSLAAVAGHVALVGAWEWWWGAQGYGARLTTGTVPSLAVLAILAGATLRAAGPSRWLTATAVAASLLAVAINARGACAASTWKWNAHPVEISEDPSRCWSLSGAQFLARWPTEPGVEQFGASATAALRRGDMAGALAALDDGLRRHPGGMNLRLLRGATRHHSGDHAGEWNDFDEAVRRAPWLADPFYNRGLAREERGDLAGARTDYDEAVRRDHRFGAAYYARALLRYRGADYPGAGADLDQHLRFERGEASAYVLRGEIRERQGDVPGALADYRAALERGPDGSVRAALERRIGELQRR